MPDDPGFEPCDLACQTKQILNSGNIAGVTQTTFRSLDLFYARGGTMPKGGKRLIQLMNKLEDDAVAVQKLACELMGYSGEVGKMLQ
jgi:hypothetical protein